MKVVGLLSGGKDSVYNLLHCVANGHEPVALANLAPPADQDEMDSYMYQTVGNSGLEAIATALRLPLHRRTITGTAVTKASTYGSRLGPASRKGKERALEVQEDAEDETEDLLLLLRDVKAKHPEIQAVSCGAILSTYQRVRVEHVCSRLSLVPLAYLWERDQKELLAEMVQAGMESVLIKVAGAGLVTSHLGRSLAQMQSTLLKLNAIYELHPCGEGGEYETFTLDCPLFHSRVVLNETSLVVSDPNPFATVAHLHLTSCILSPKPDYPHDESWKDKVSRIREIVAVPPLLDEEALEVRKTVEGLPQPENEVLGLLKPSVAGDEKAGSEEVQVQVLSGWVVFGEVYAKGMGEEPEVEMAACFEALEELLQAQGSSLLEVAHLSLYLHPTLMPLFPRLNAVYSTFFGSSPPTRACVAVSASSFESGRRMKLEGWARVAGGTDEDRKALHVQSLSYWAGANIGPYSQAVTTGGRTFVAGQIPLIPRDLSLPSPPNFALETVLSLQHVRRVRSCANEGRGASRRAECAVVWIAECGLEDWRKKAQIALAAWRETEMAQDVPVVVVSSPALPKGASIEWQVTFKEEAPAQLDEDGDELPAALATRELSSTSGDGWAAGASSFAGATSGYVALMQGGTPSLPALGKLLQARQFFGPAMDAAAATAKARAIVAKEVPISLIGCEHLATAEGAEWDMIMVLNGEL